MVSLEEDIDDGQAKDHKAYGGGDEDDEDQAEGEANKVLELFVLFVDPQLGELGQDGGGEGGGDDSQGELDESVAVNEGGVVAFTEESGEDTTDADVDLDDGQAEGRREEHKK